MALAFHAAASTAKSKVRPPRAASTPSRGRNFRSSHGRWISLCIVIAVHAIAVALLWQYAPKRSAQVAPKPMTVSIIAPRERVVLPEPPKPVVPPRPAIRPLRAFVPAQPQPVVAPPSIAPTPITMPPPPLIAPAESAPPSAPVAATEVVAEAPESAPPATVTPPRFDADYLRNPTPAYPPISRRNGEQGRVLLRVLVGADGAPQDVLIKSSSGIERLDRAASDAVRRWRFVPARVGSDAVAAWVLVPIAFNLQG